ncbi:MAG TPA: hypothetical protein VGM03_22530 [Phycisphaerae bacterium]|jgi:hypothetical protein
MTCTDVYRAWAMGLAHPFDADGVALVERAFAAAMDFPEPLLIADPLDRDIAAFLQHAAHGECAARCARLHEHIISRAERRAQRGDVDAALVVASWDQLRASCRLTTAAGVARLW